MLQSASNIEVKSEVRKRGRPRKYPSGEAPSTMKIARNKLDNKNIQEKDDDSAEDLDKSSDDVLQSSYYPRRSTRSVYNTGDNKRYSDGYTSTSYDDEDEENEGLTSKSSDQKKNLREKKNLCSAKISNSDVNEESTESGKRVITLFSKKKNTLNKNLVLDNDESSSTQAEDWGNENAVDALSEEDLEEVEHSKVNHNKNKLSAELERKSTQIEKILAYRISKKSPNLNCQKLGTSDPARISMELTGSDVGKNDSTSKRFFESASVLQGSKSFQLPEEYQSITQKILNELENLNSNSNATQSKTSSVVIDVSKDVKSEDIYVVKSSSSSIITDDSEKAMEIVSEAVSDVKLAVPDDANHSVTAVPHTSVSQISYEYLVKYKKKSYLHCEWIPEIVVEKAKLGKQRLQRFLSSKPELDLDPPFDPAFTVVDRILDKKVHGGRVWYYVKWCSLSYNEATWEPYDIINDSKAVKKFETINKIPQVIVDHNAPVIRPSVSSFKQLQDLKFKNGNKLRPYQLEGMNWLRSCWYNHRNSILADEMGLGKTVQTVSILWYLYKFQNIRGPFLIIVPLSTIPHWIRELETWTDMNVLLYHGNYEARKLMRDYEFYYRDQHRVPAHKNIFKFHVIVTTYEMLLTDTDVLRPISWKYVAIDEAHRLKNKSSRVLIEFRYFHYDHLLLLTGTPIQNNTQELWTLLNLLDPSKFESLDEFLENFGNLQDAEQATKLQKILHPFLLRRMKEDVEKTIARKEETIIEVELTTIQKKYYRAVLERSFDNLVQGSRSKSCLPSLLNIMMQLRKCCNHPYLLRGVEETELGIVSESSKTQQIANETLIESSGKLVLIDKLLPCLKADGHKILIFSQMVRVLDILEDYLNYRGYKHERIDGSVRSNDRQAAIDRFSRPDSEIFVFLLCTRAGGVGINLTAADTVIIFDSDWNPQNDLQAQARCHRIGQHKNVQVYRLLTRGTYERVMFERASLKLGLDQAVLNRMSFDEDGESKPKFSSTEVDALLKHGAYDLFRDDDNSSERFREENIEEILSKRTTRIVHESTGGSNSLLSKASFASEHANADLDVNDPDFWKKVMPNQVDRPDPNIIDEPRQRRTINRSEVSSINESSELDLGSDNENTMAASDDDVYMDQESRKETSKNERRRKIVGPYFQAHNWNVTQRNRFVRAVQLLGFGRWREIKRNAKLFNKSLKEIAYYGRAYLHKIVSYATLAEGDTVEKIISRIINSEDGIEDLTEDPWKSSVPSQVLAYKAHKEESEEGVSSELIQQAAERYEQIKALTILKHKRDLEYLSRKKIHIEQNTLLQQPMGVETIEMGGLGPSCSIRSSPELPDFELPSQESDDSIVIFWHLNDEEMKSEVKEMLDDPMLNDQRFLENVKSTATQTIRRFELLAEIGALVRSNFGEFADESFPKIETGDPAYFGKNWTAQFDRDLLFGTWRWGFGQYEKMTRDPLLSLYGIYKSKPTKEKSKSTEGEGADEFDEEMDDGKKRAAASNKSPEEDFTADLTVLEMEQVEDESAVENDVSAAKDTNFNSEASTKDTKTPPQKKSSTAVVLDESQLLELPPSKLLTHRVKHILKTFNTMRKKKAQNELRERKRLEKEREREEKQKRREDKEAAWSKKDRSDFYRVLTTFGVFLNDEGFDDWQEFFSKCRFANKTLKSLEAFYNEFVTVCRYIRENYADDMTPRLQENLSEEQAKELENITAKIDCFKLTNSQVKKVLGRLALFSCLRGIFYSLDGSQIKAKLSQINHPIVNFKLPIWWHPSLQYDYSLLLGVHRYGIGNWDNFTIDPDLAFSMEFKCNQDGVSQDFDAAENSSYDCSFKQMTTHQILPAEKLLMRRLIFLLHQLVAMDIQWKPRTDGVVNDPSAAFEQEFAEQINELNAIISGALPSNVKNKKTRKFEPTAPSEVHNAKRQHIDSYFASGSESYVSSEKSTNIEYDMQGNVVYPIKLKGTLSIDSLGVATDRPAFHSDKYVWPPGFTSHREYLSTLNPEKRSLYRSEILVSQDGNSPVFRVTPEDDPNNYVEAPTASQAWKMIINRVNQLKPEKFKRTSVSGPEYFGFANARIAQLISNLQPSESIQSNQQLSECNQSNSMSAECNQSNQQLSEFTQSNQQLSEFTQSNQQLSEFTQSNPMSAEYSAESETLMQKDKSNQNVHNC